jgi:HlyD family secretion protein
MSNPTPAVEDAARLRESGRAAREGEPASRAGRGAGLERDLGKVEGKRWLRRLLMLGGLVVVVGALFVVRAKTKPPPPPKYVTATVSVGDVIETVQSTGAIQPVTEVQVGAQVSGRVTKVYVDFNSQVKAGDLVAEIDPSLFGEAIAGNQAQLTAARASVTSAETQVTTEKVKLERLRRLVTEGIGSQADLDTESGVHDVAVANLAAAKANVNQIMSVLRSSKTNLDYTKIYSPIDGIVITRSIDPGQTVAASFQAPVLFVIAQDLRKMRVLADIDEADVGRLSEGMSADVTVDAFPGDTFHGIVNQVRFSPTTTSGVTTYAAVIDVDNPDVKLRPGMTATIKITSATAKGATRIPNAALRFKPSPPVDKDGKKIPQEPLPALGANKGRVWIVKDETPGAEKAEMREIDVGITDGSNTVVKTDLTGQKLVVDENDDPNKKRGPF